MKILKWLAILVVGAPAILIAFVYLRNKAVGPEGWAMDNTIDKLRTRMKDPESMVIRSSFIVHHAEAEGQDDVIAICGVVDAKNSFGGYTGGTRFVSRSVSSRKFDTFDTGEVILEKPEEQRLAESVHMLSGFDNVYWNPQCVDAGHPAVKPAT
jgi:hypothetical protein